MISLPVSYGQPRGYPRPGAGRDQARRTAAPVRVRDAAADRRPARGTARGDRPGRDRGDRRTRLPRRQPGRRRGAGRPHPAGTAALLPHAKSTCWSASSSPATAGPAPAAAPPPHGDGTPPQLVEYNANRLAIVRTFIGLLGDSVTEDHPAGAYFESASGACGAAFAAMLRAEWGDTAARRTDAGGGRAAPRRRHGRAPVPVAPRPGARRHARVVPGLPGAAGKGPEGRGERGDGTVGAEETGDGAGGE